MIISELSVSHILLPTLRFIPCWNGKTLITASKSWEVREQSLRSFVSLNFWSFVLMDSETHEIHPLTPKKKAREKERCSGSFHLAVGFLVIKDDSISERPSLWQWGSRYTAHLDGTYLSRNFATLGPVTDSRHLVISQWWSPRNGQKKKWWLNWGWVLMSWVSHWLRDLDNCCINDLVSRIFGPVLGFLVTRKLQQRRFVNIAKIPKNGSCSINLTVCF